ncbi:hypothetical protein OCT51_06215 [Halomonas sp. LR3S48]|uniref:hypothetical protein n=1 Tax=Halomonas sp. LR3S48 TaxID=2982694 RepID=UPI0021E45901|nr:hypothetical protein [Halomonas sp. LR3S48]UYG04954.1 hypothetical protein OCT51_06215 [Halomonas sp. LR3S48]
MSKADQAPTEPKAGKKLPKWMTDHFQKSLDAHENLGQIIRLSEKGISVLRGMPKVVKVIADLDGRSDDAGYEEKIRRAEEEANLAQAEIDKDFPVLHQFAVVALWSWLEHFVKDFVALWLQHRKGALTLPQLSKIKIRLGEYLQLSKAEQASYIVELLEQELGSPLKKGVTRFESLLEPFSLSGSLPQGCAQAIFELQQVRNVIAHRNGIADRRLKSACPWLKVRVGHPVNVGGDMLGRYSEASGAYLLEVLYRVGDAHGLDLRASAAQDSEAVDADPKKNTDKNA